MHLLSKPNIFFTSDYHIYHEKILLLGKGRPFANVEEMHAAIADRHNAVVRPGDKVYNFGDFALKCTWEQAYAFRQRLVPEVCFRLLLRRGQPLGVRRSRCGIDRTLGFHQALAFLSSPRLGNHGTNALVVR